MEIAVVGSFKGTESRETGTGRITFFIVQTISGTRSIVNFVKLYFREHDRGFGRFFGIYILKVHLTQYTN